MKAISIIVFLLFVFWVYAGCHAEVGVHKEVPPYTRCDRWEHALSHSGSGVMVLLVELGCSGFANQDIISIDMRLKNGKRITFFQYEDASWNPAYYNQTTPSAEWIDTNHLGISIGAVDYIHKQLKVVDNVNIEYDIKHVLEKR